MASGDSQRHVFSVPLGTRLTGDLLSAAGASAGLSPFVTTIDKSIISNASGRQKLVPCLQENAVLFLTRPHQFVRLREFQLIYGVYTATYLSANFADTLSRHHFHVDPTYPVFFATTAVNLTTCIAKDRAFTRMFGLTAPKALPLVTYALFAVRDSLTIGASFSLVPHLGDWIFRRSRERSKGTELTSDECGLSKQRSTQIAQLSCPMGIQFVSTPLHLCGLDLYNRPDAKFFPDRFQFISREYVKSVAARIARIAPAFGFGGIGNTWLRGEYMKIYGNTGAG